MRRLVTVRTGLRRIGLGAAVLVMAATAALVAPAAPASAVGEFCTLDIIAPRLNAATKMVEAPAMVTCDNLPSGVTVNRIDIGVFLLKGNSAQAAHLYGHSQPGNPFYGLSWPRPHATAGTGSGEPPHEPRLPSRTARTT
jgi:hypothetical protein